MSTPDLTWAAQMAAKLQAMPRRTADRIWSEMTPDELAQMTEYHDDGFKELLARLDYLALHADELLASAA